MVKPKTTERTGAMKRILAAALAGFGLSGPLTADELPFYKAGSGTTQRPAASVARSSSPVGLDSRTVQTASSEPVVFDSDGVPGMAIIIR